MAATYSMTEQTMRNFVAQYRTQFVIAGAHV